MLFFPSVRHVQVKQFGGICVTERKRHWLGRGELKFGDGYFSSSTNLDTHCLSILSEQPKYVLEVYLHPGYGPYSLFQMSRLIHLSCQSHTP
jgi:hypothetical protein